jgi:L-rhamnose isomerase
VDSQGDTRFAVFPGDEEQRQMAYRFGLNTVIYALTGNYKGDQVHVPEILKRMGQ